MTTFYHGTDRELDTSVQARGLHAGSYVTRHYKDAVKFGYRKAVTNGSETIRVYTVGVEELGIELAPDPKRDRAFVVKQDAPVTLLTSMPTWLAPHKLRRFHMPGRFDR